MIIKSYVWSVLLSPTLAALVVTIPDGEIRAKSMMSHQKHLFWGFQSIPYAQPPLGDLRWMPPLPSQGWNGTLDGSLNPKMCLQGFPDPETTHDSLEPEYSAMFGYEDCLVLNVYTQDVTPEAKFPVLVWFHGGGLSTGQGDMYGPQLFIDYDIIIVTVNYRLGPLGQLSLNTGEVSGNQGLRDQILALQWIQENIEYFGGDKEKVTIAGESAGSWSVMHHLLAPESDGLFRAVIGQSGTTISGLADRFMTEEEAFVNGQNYAREIGCYGEGEEWIADLVMECLKTKSPRELFDAHVSGTFSSRPNIDSFSQHPSVLPGDPELLFSSEQFSKVPVLIGTNSGEGILNVPEYIKNPELLKEHFQDVSYWDEERGPFFIFDREPRLNKTDFGEYDVEIARLAREFYFGETIDEDDLKKMINLNSDVQFWFGTDKLIQYLSPHVAVYHYILFFQDLFSFTINPNTLGKDLGVGHADDLAYMWDIFSLNSNIGLYDVWWSQADKLNSARMLELWSNFVKHMDPTPQNALVGALPDVVWEPVTIDNHQYLRIDRNLTMEMTNDYIQRMGFWRNVENIV